MARKKLSLEQLEMELKQVCAQDTSAAPEGWTTDNPLWGHSAVVAMMVQDLFGGELLRASLENTPFAFARSHYWNRLPNGREVDLTASQFGGHRPELTGETLARDRRPLTREVILKDPKTYDRHAKLVSRMFVHLVAHGYAFKYLTV